MHVTKGVTDMMNKSKIQWTDFSWNPITGCYHTCPYCYGGITTG